VTSLPFLLEFFYFGRLLVYWLKISNFYEFVWQVRLCLSAGNHYDSVYSRSFMEAAAMSQCKLTMFVDNARIYKQEILSRDI